MNNSPNEPLSSIADATGVLCHIPARHPTPPTSVA